MDMTIFLCIAVLIIILGLLIQAILNRVYPPKENFTPALRKRLSRNLYEKTYLRCLRKFRHKKDDP